MGRKHAFALNYLPGVMLELLVVGKRCGTSQYTGAKACKDWKPDG
jgi:hypothetical protein